MRMDETRVVLAYHSSLRLPPLFACLRTARGAGQNCLLIVLQSGCVDSSSELWT